MNIEEEIKFLKIDFHNIRKELSELITYQENSLEFLRKNLEVLFLKNGLNLRHKYQCKKCDGSGIRYISPICDMGQDQKCSDCHGEGFVWL